MELTAGQEVAVLGDGYAKLLRVEYVTKLKIGLDDGTAWTHRGYPWGCGDTAWYRGPMLRVLDEDTGKQVAKVQAINRMKNLRCRILVLVEKASQERLEAALAVLETP